MRPTPRQATLVVAAAALGIALSACATYKPGSFQLTQPGGIGAVRLHLALCTTGEEPASKPCEAGERTGEAQSMLAFAVPKGSSAPATVTATPGPGAPPIAFSRSQEVADRVAELERGEGEPPWPPPGSEIVGYLSAVYGEKATENLEWTIDADIGLPTAAGGGSFAGPFGAGLVIGWRLVDAGEHPSSRPINCSEGTAPFNITGSCGISDEGQIGVSDLRITAPGAARTVYAGGTASVPFSLDFGGTAALPSFALSGATTLAGATVALPVDTYAPGGLDAQTHRAPAASRSAIVTVPATARAGTYDVSITAGALAGGSVTGIAKLTVSKPAIKLGKVKLNKGKGTATLSVKVPDAGGLTVFGKNIVKVERTTQSAKSLKIAIKPRAKAKRALTEAGKVKVKAKFRFTPSSGSPVTTTKPITLKLQLAG